MGILRFDRERSESLKHHFPRDYYELLGPSGVATLKRLLTESLENSQPGKRSKGHLDAGLARLRLELEG